MNITRNMERGGFPAPAGVILIVALILTLSLACGRNGSTDDLPIQSVKLPPGFRIEVFARVPGARSMAISPNGTVFVGTRQDKVYAIFPGEGASREVLVVAKGLDTPNGVTVLDGSLYVAEVSRVIRFDAIEANVRAPGKPAVVRDNLPDKGGHNWRYMRAGPDGRLYLGIGAPCNVCDRGDPFASVMRMKPDGSDFEIFARGVRNTVGFDWNPATKEMWFTDNGRDLLGDDLPPDELNCAPVSGMNFGYPFCYGDNVPDPDFGKGRDCGKYAPMKLGLGAHVASLGMRFYTGDRFGAHYKGGIFIAEHGSWNRSTPIGYRIVFVPMNGGVPQQHEIFAEGWLKSGRAWGRPVDVQVMPDGSLLISDDDSGTVYRVSYRQ